MRKLFTLVLAFLSFSTTAQDYGYDEFGSSNTEESQLPVEGPEKPQRQRNRPTRANRPKTLNTLPQQASQPDIFRMGIKLGGNFTSYSESGKTPISGWGAEGGLTFGWDLAFQPIFLELELGYKYYLMTESTLQVHVIPLRFATFYRLRIGERSLWKIGLAPSLDLRINNPSASSPNFVIAPGLSFSSIWEFGNFLVEPTLSLYRIQSDANYYSLGLRTGFRF